MQRINTNIILPELSYQIMGALFTVHNSLGPRYQEKYYQRAIAIEMKKVGLSFQKEFCVNLNYGNNPIGRYFIDFIVADKIVIETKSLDFLRKKDWKQVLAYLTTAKLPLAILVNFNQPRLIYKRIVNPELGSKEP